MKTRRQYRAKAGRCACAIALALLFAPGLVPAGEAAAPDGAQSLGGVMGSLGENVQLQAAPEGEFVVYMNEANEVTMFRAIRDVFVTTDEMSLRCHEMIYDRQAERLTALAPPNGLVHIAMSGVAGPGAIAGSGGEIQATCRLYEFDILKNEHVLKHDPVIYQRDDAGKETAVTGQLVTINQNEKGQWQMNIKGERGRSIPASEDEYQRERLMKRARDMWGVIKPIINIDLNAEESTTAQASPSTGTGPVKLDAGNLDRVMRAKPDSLTEIQRGGSNRFGEALAVPRPEP